MKTLQAGMELCTPRNPVEVAPQYLVTRAIDRHIIEVMNVKTREKFPVWRHPKLSPYRERILNCGLTPHVWEDGEDIVWLNTLVFDLPPYDEIIDVVGAFNQGVRYSGMLHLNEDWKCTYATAYELGLFLSERQAG